MSSAKKRHLYLLHGDIPDWAYSSVRAILQSLNAVDPETAAHCLRVGEWARLLSKAAGLSEYEQKVAEFSGILHDVGKLAISKEITHKPGRLTELEYDIMKQHPIQSEQIVEPLTYHEFFRQVNPAVRAHHERLDGKGYPDKLFDDQIPLIAKVVSVVDCFDAMGQSRAYRKGLPEEVILAELDRCAGTQFDPVLVKTFKESLESLKKEAPDQITLHKIVKKVA